MLKVCGVDPGRVRSVTELTGGTYNAVYRIGLGDGTAVVLKVAPDPGAPAMGYEHDLMRTEAMFYTAAPDRLPVPRVLHADFGRTVVDRDLLLMTECPGTPWHAQRDQLDAADTARMRFDLGGMVAALHEVTGAGYGYPQFGLASSWPVAFLGMVDAVLADAGRFGVLLPRPRDEIRAVFRAGVEVLDAVRRPVLVHFDLWDGNVLVDATTAARPRIGGIIDGERAFWGDPLAELVSLALFGRIEQDRDFLAGYRAGGGVVTFDGSTRRRLTLYRCYLYLIMIVETVPRGGGAEHDRTARYVGRLLTRALATLSAPDPERDR